MGNQSIGTYDRFTVYELYNNSYAYNNQTVSGAGFKLGKDNLTWEKTKTFNVGVDASFFNNALNVTFDYFYKRTSDILMKPLVPSVFGTDMAMDNIGEMQNQGWDLSINYRLKTGAANHNFNFNLGDSWNEVLKYPGHERISQIEELSRITREGCPLESYYGYKMDGFFQSYEEIEASAIPVGGKVQPGDVKFVDVDHNGIIDDNDKVDLGNGMPDLLMVSIWASTIKGFDFSLNANGSVGNKIVQSYRNHTNKKSNYTTAILNRWTGEGTSNRYTACD